MSTAGSLTVTTAQTFTPTGMVTRFTLEWASDGSGNVTGQTVNVRGGEIMLVEFVPGTGSEQPSDGYAVTLTDANGIDALAGAGSTLSHTTPTAAVPTVSTYFRRFVEAGSLTLGVSGAGATKGGQVLVYIR